MIPIKRSLKFRLEKRKNKKENLPIRLRVSYLGNRFDLYTGHNCDLKAWANEKVNSTFINKTGISGSQINAELNSIYTKIDNTFRLFELQDKVPNKEDLKNAVHPEKKEDSKLLCRDTLIKDIFEVLEEFVIINGKLNNWTRSTFQKFEAVRNHLYDFNPNLKFEDFNEEGLSDYLTFLQRNKKMRNSTIKKHLGFLKWFLRWALIKNYTNVDDFIEFKPKIKNTQKKVIFLTEEEKDKILSANIPSHKEYLHRVRDVLMFTCYTGLRYSDVYNLKRSDIKNNKIEIITVKTYDSLVIELNKFSQSILKKYENIPYKYDKALPVISNQKMNVYLKELGKIAGLDDKVRITHYEGNRRVDNVYPKYQLISTHIGRRTFIITALSIGIPVQVVMKWTGHSDYKAMKPYVDIADKTKENEMEKFNLI